MRSRVALLIALGLVVFHAPVQTQARMTFATVTIPQTSTPLPAAVYSGKGGCQARLEGGPVRFRADGVAPSATVGTPLNAGEMIMIDYTLDAEQVRFFAQGTQAGTLSVWCWPKQ